MVRTSVFGFAVSFFLILLTIYANRVLPIFSRPSLLSLFSLSCICISVTPYSCYFSMFPHFPLSLNFSFLLLLLLPLFSPLSCILSLALCSLTHFYENGSV